MSKFLKEKIGSNFFVEIFGSDFCGEVLVQVTVMGIIDSRMSSARDILFYISLGEQEWQSGYSK